MSDLHLSGLPKESLHTLDMLVAMHCLAAVNQNRSEDRRRILAGIETVS